MRVGIVLYDRTRRHLYTSGGAAHISQRKYHLAAEVVVLVEVVEEVVAEVVQVQVEAEVRAQRGRRRAHRLGR